MVARAALLAPLLCLAAVGTARGADEKLGETSSPDGKHSQTGPRDVVTTKTGGELSGWVTRYVPSSYVILYTDAGSVTVAAGEIVTVSFADRGPEAGFEVAARLLRESAAPSAGATAAPPAKASITAPAGAVEGNIDRGMKAAPAPNDSALKAALNTAKATQSAKPKLVTQRAWLDTTAGTLGRSTTGPDGSASIQEANLRRGLVRHEEVAANGDRTSTEVDAIARAARHQRSTDCATPEDPNCSRAASLTVGIDGLGAELSETRVAAVKMPPSAYAVVGLDAGIVGITSDAVRGMAGQIGFGVRGAAGGRLPAGTGGGWSGLGFDAQLGLSAGQVQVLGFDGAPISVDFRLGSLAGAIGYQYLHFRKLDPETLKQRGFGLFLGYRAGINQDLQNEDSELAVSHGPQIALSFPSYNAGTASVSDLAIKGMILPTGDLTLFAVTLGYGF